jgi:hypothetical protein
VEAVRKVDIRPKAGASKGRGVKPRKVTERVIRTAGGPKVTVEFRRGIDGRAIEAALEQALATIRAELAGDQAAA